jgi:hypothetical protein
MKLTGIVVSMPMIPGPRFVEQAVFLGTAFLAARFDAIGPVGDGIGCDPSEQQCDQVQGLSLRTSPEY